MRALALIFALTLLPACQGKKTTEDNTAIPLSLDDELGFRQLRQNFHQAMTTGDADLLRDLWTDDAVLATGTGEVLVGGDAITAFLASNPEFGRNLVVTRESSWAAAVQDDVAQYGFETISIDVGDDVPGTTPLSIGGAQNPDVEIVAHTNSTGMVVRGEDGRWKFQELNGASGPLLSPLEPREATIGGAVVGNTLTIGDEVGFRRMRETFHLANLMGDRDLMRTVWADDSLFVTGGGTRFEGGDTITEFFANRPAFGKQLVVTPESSQTLTIVGDTAEYAFECIAIDIGDNDPMTIDLCTAGGTQNPNVEIVFHSHSQGIAQRVAEGRWIFKEFHGGLGPLPTPQ